MLFTVNLQMKSCVSLVTLRNKKPTIVKKDISESDGIKYVLDMKEKSSFNAQSNAPLKEFGFTIQVKVILNKSNQILETQATYFCWTYFCQLQRKPHSAILDATVASYNRPDLGQCSMYLSSGAVRFERVLENLYA